MLGHDIVWTLSEALPANWHQQSVGNDLVYSSAIGLVGRRDCFP